MVLSISLLHFILTGKLTYDEMVRDLEMAIHQFAKRQMTWFRGMEKRGIKIHWIEGHLPLEKKVEKVMELLGIHLLPT
jgi:tRNA dimethylallyltransferase